MKPAFEPPTEIELQAQEDFRRFLALDLRPNGPKVEVPEEWIPYVLGRGPAPPAPVEEGGPS